MGEHDVYSTMRRWRELAATTEEEYCNWNLTFDREALRQDLSSLEASHPEVASRLTRDGIT